MCSHCFVKWEKEEDRRMQEEEEQQEDRWRQEEEEDRRRQEEEYEVILHPCQICGADAEDGPCPGFCSRRCLRTWND
jgi:hypothetical protein